MEKRKRLSPKTSKDIVDALGGSVVLASYFGVSREAVLNWTRRGMPKARVMTLRLAYPFVQCLKSPEVREL